MRRASTLFLKTVILFIGIVVLYSLIRFPQTEGRAANLDLISIYKDPFIIYIYIASIPFFVGLYQVFKFLGYIGHNKVLSLHSVRALRNIKYCAISISVSIVVAMLFVISTVKDDDPAGFIAIGIFLTFASIAVATTAAVLKKRLENALRTKSKT